jgi:hypothetical protein
MITELNKRPGTLRAVKAIGEKIYRIIYKASVSTD